MKVYFNKISDICAPRFVVWLDKSIFVVSIWRWQFNIEWFKSIFHQ